MRWWLALVALLGICAQAFVPAPIQWAGLPDKRFVLVPNFLVVGRNTGPHPLMIWDRSDVPSPDRIPHFSTQSDNTIAWDSTGMCLEASGDKIKAQIGVNYCTGRPNQLWSVVPWGHGGKTHIKLEGTQRCLGMGEKEGSLNGVPIELRDCERKGTEAWIFEEPITLPNEGLAQHLSPFFSMRHAMISLAVMAVLGISSLSASLYRRRVKARSAWMHASIGIDVASSGCASGSHVRESSGLEIGEQRPAIQGHVLSRVTHRNGNHAQSRSMPIMQSSGDAGGNASTTQRENGPQATEIRDLLSLGEVEQEMQGRTTPAVFLFGQKACRKCRAMARQMVRLGKEHKDTGFFRVDYAFDTKEAFDKYEVKATPRFAVIEPDVAPNFMSSKEMLAHLARKLQSKDTSCANFVELQTSAELRQELQDRRTPVVFFFAQEQLRSRERGTIEKRLRALAEGHPNVTFFHVIYSSATREAFAECGVTATPRLMILKPDSPPGFRSIDELTQEIDQMERRAQKIDDDASGPIAFQIPSWAPIVVPALEAPLIAAAFVIADSDDIFAKHCDSFNAECYNVLFNWIPRIKEAGFGTFNVTDTLAQLKKVRKMLPSARELFLRSAAPELFGCPWEEVPRRLGFESPKELIKSYLKYAAPGNKGGAFGLPLPFELPFGGNVGNVAKLQEALGGEAALDELSAGVEQAAALYCNLLVMAADADASADLASEQAEALKDVDPLAPITSEILCQMPKLDAFVIEVRRLQPAVRPERCTLTEATTVSFAKVAFVQTRRMFNVSIREGAQTRLGGPPLRTVPETEECQYDARVFYELRRELIKPVLQL